MSSMIKGNGGYERAQPTSESVVNYVTRILKEAGYDLLFSNRSPEEIRAQTLTKIEAARSFWTTNCGAKVVVEAFTKLDLNPLLPKE